MRGREWLVFFGVTAFAGMLTMLISKEKVAELAIKVSTLPPSLHPSLPSFLFSVLRSRFWSLPPSLPPSFQVAGEDAHDTNFSFLDKNLDLVSFTTLLAISSPSLPPSLFPAGGG